MHNRLTKTLLVTLAALAAPLSASALTSYVEQEALDGNAQWIDASEYAGTLVNNDSIVISGYLGSTPGGSVSPDYFSFSALANQWVQVSILTQNASNNALLGLFQGFTRLNSASENNTLTNPPLTFTQLLSSAGTYVVGVNGYSEQSNGFDSFGGSSGWQYQVTITSVAQPVPEPEPVALLLAGLGALGLMSRRRQPA